MSLAVASRYARALVDILFSPGSTLPADLAMAQLRIFEAMIEESVELRNVLISPSVSPARKRAVVGRFAQQVPFSTTIRNFLYVLIDHRRTALLPAILASIEAQMDERSGIVRAQIKSARPLDETQRGSVEASLARLTGKKIRGQYSVDDSLIGGVTAKVGSRVYDGSVAGQLAALRSRLVRS
jgi:F-type H+-transporting ATPase subunit delta